MQSIVETPVQAAGASLSINLMNEQSASTPVVVFACTKPVYCQAPTFGSQLRGYSR